MRRCIPAVAATLQQQEAQQHVRPRRGPELPIDGPTRQHATAAPPHATLAPAALCARRPGAPGAVFTAGAVLCLGFLGMTRLSDFGGTGAAMAAVIATPGVNLGTLPGDQTEPVVLGEIADRATRCPPGGRIRLRWKEQHGRFLLLRDIEYDPTTGRLWQRVDGGEAFTFGPVTAVGIARALARDRAGSFAAALALSRPSGATATAPGAPPPSADL